MSNVPSYAAPAVTVPSGPSYVSPPNVTWDFDPFRSLTWGTMRRLIGGPWSAGLSLFFHQNVADQELPENYWIRRDIGDLMPELALSDGLVGDRRSELWLPDIGGDRLAPPLVMPGIAAPPAREALPDIAPMGRSVGRVRYRRGVDVMAQVERILDQAPSRVSSAGLNQLARTVLRNRVDTVQSLALTPYKAGVLLSTKLDHVDPKYQQRRRNGDDKLGGRQLRWVYRAFSATFGAVDELREVATALAANVYERDQYGNIGSVYERTRSVSGTLRRFSEGKAELDVVGFVADHAWNQGQDVITGIEGAPVAFFRRNIPHHVPVGRDQPLQWGDAENGILQTAFDGLSPAARGQLRRTAQSLRDAGRAQRVRALFGP